MLSWASYLFGGGSSDPQPDESQSQPEPAPMETEAVSGDKDWVVVEHGDCHFGTKPPEHTSAYTTCYHGSTLRSDAGDLVHLAQSARDPATLSPAKCDSSSSSPSKHSTPDSLSPVSHSRYLFVRTNHGCSQEAWLLTPPSCFTAGSNDSPQVGITDLENLLIEHPSMSVYKRSGSAGEESNLSESSGDEASNSKRSQAISRQGPKRVRTVSARAQLLAQVSQVKRSQTLQQKKSTKRNNKKNLQRMNITCDKKSPKNNRARKPSGQKNGRIPQRKL